jgi:hypothetical protein
MSTLIGKSIGILCTGLGLFILWASPISSVTCSRDGGGVSCRVDRALLGVVPIEGAQVRHVQGTDIVRASPLQPTSRPATNPAPLNDTYQLAFLTTEGRVVPRGVDASSSAPIHEIADQVNDLVKGDGGPFTARNYNGFPNVAGGIFLFVGLVMVLFAR